MKLIGMLDSPYVRRVAISLQLLGLPFEHDPVSVFRGFDTFSRINPVVKAPTLVCDDGTVLMDSSLILEYAEALARPRTLLPSEPAALARELRMVGLALTACEKCVQVVYEHMLRPSEKVHQPWLDRVTGQLKAAFEQLEHGLGEAPPVPDAGSPGQGVVSAAVAWHFTQAMHPELLPADRCPGLVALSAWAEALPAFAAAAHGPGRVPVSS